MAKAKATRATTKTSKAKTEKTVRTRKTKRKPVAKILKAEEVQRPSEEKQAVISQFQVKEGDTGSPEVQVALLTKRIDKLVAHLKTNPSDNHSRRGLLGIVSKRRRLLSYLEKKNVKRYKDLVVKLGLGK